MLTRIKTLAVFCGASLGSKPEYTAAILSLTQLLIKNNISLVYGGGRLGLMGVLADSMLEKGGQVYGVIPRALIEKEVAHASLSKLYVVKSMHERKLLMSELADAFIVLPGGIGSLDEFFEIYTWAKLGLHNKPIGLLNTSEYYSSIIQFLDQAVSDGFLAPAHREILFIHDNSDTLLQQLDSNIPVTENLTQAAS